jgi:hemolysin activation/secretion protein
MTMPKTEPNPALRLLALVVITLCALLAQAAHAQQSLAPPSGAIIEPTLDIRQYVIDGHNPMSPGDTEKLLSPFTGDKRALSQIEQAAMALEKALRAAGFVFHRVFVPVQKPKDGQVTLQIIEFTIDKVNISGNENFSSDNIRRSLPGLVEGTVPDIREIGEDLTAANTNPSKHVTVTFKESAKPDSVDAVLKVKDAHPLSYFLGYTGNMPAQPRNPDDSISRVTAGFQHSNLFDRDHVASFTYTTDPTKIDKVSLLGFYYQFPIYGKGLNLSAYYTTSDINSGAGAQGGPDVTGRGQFMGVRVTKSLPRTGPLQQTLGLALDDKHFESDAGNAVTALIPGLVVPDQNVGSRPVSVRYTFRQEEPWGGFGGNLDYVFNLDGGTANSPANYAAQGFFATPNQVAADFQWQAWRFGLDGNYRSGNWVYSGRVRGQISTNSLIPGEKFSLGGVNSVRGFADAKVRGDWGYSVNLEALGPEMFAPQLRPLIYMDGGQVRSNFGINEDLLSIGGGFRWVYQKMDVSADLAYVLKADSQSPQTNPIRLNIALFYRF